MSCLFPAIAFCVLILWPWIERRFTGDRTAHLLDRPATRPPHRHGPGRPVLFVIPFLAGSGDVLAVLLNVSVEKITRILRYALVIALVLTWLGGVLGVPLAARDPGATRPPSPRVCVCGARPVGGTRPSGRTLEQRQVR